MLFPRRISRSWPASMLGAAVALLATMQFVGCGDGDGDGDPVGPGETIPAAWAGDYSVHIAITACGAPDPYFESDDTQTLCAGDDASFEDDEGSEVTCDGTVTDTEVHVTCTSTYTFQGDVYVNTNVIDMVRSGDTFTGTIHYTTTVNGEPYDCGDIEITATRTGPGTCTSAVPFLGAIRELVADLPSGH